MIIFAYILATMFSIGIIIIYINLTLLCFKFSKLQGSVSLLCGAGLTVILCAMPFVVLSYIQSPNLATLKKAEWTCSISHTEYTSIGKTGSIRTVCDRYERLKF